jgi:O-antigen ligase
MNPSSVFRRYDYAILLVFAFTAVASIALQSLIWAAIALFFFSQFENKTKINWPINLFTIATLLFLATFFIGAILGINPAKSFETVHKYLTFLIIFPLGTMFLSITDIRKSLHIFIAGASFCAVYGVGKHFLLHQDRIDSFSGDKMVFGGMLMVSLILIFSFLAHSPKNYWFWTAFALVFWALLLTETRGAWVGALIGFSIFVFRWNKKWLLIGALFLLGLFFVLPKDYQERIKSIPNIHYFYNEHMQNEADNGKINNATNPRLLIWVSGLQIIKDFPLGVGQGNIEDIYPKYRIATKDSDPTVPHLHNNYLQILAQNGWLGFAAYLFWIFAFYFEAFRFKSTEAEANQLSWTMVCVFSAVLVWGITEYTFSHQFMNVQFFLLGITTALWAQHSSSKKI